MEVIEQLVIKLPDVRLLSCVNMMQEDGTMLNAGMSAPGAGGGKGFRRHARVRSRGSGF